MGEMIPPLDGGDKPHMTPLVEAVLLISGVASQAVLLISGVTWHLMPSGVTKLWCYLAAFSAKRCYKC